MLFIYEGFDPRTNQTSITLIPKCENADHVKLYRPIACCNVALKIISKLLTNKMKGVMSDTINLRQPGFNPGRHLSDNVLLATELRAPELTIVMGLYTDICLTLLG